MARVASIFVVLAGLSGAGLYLWQDVSRADARRPLSAPESVAANPKMHRWPAEAPAVQFVAVNPVPAPKEIPLPPLPEPSPPPQLEIPSLPKLEIPVPSLEIPRVETPKLPENALPGKPELLIPIREEKLPPVPPPETIPPLSPPPPSQDRNLPAARPINSREVAFRYSITQQGSSGIRAVELWVTENDGRSWEMLTTQEGSESPLRARLPGEGTYGFKLVVVNGNNQRFGEPLPGEAPKLRTELDMTLPRVKLFVPEKKPHALGLVWNVSDKNLLPANFVHEQADSPRPFRLEWSPDDTNWIDVHADGWLPLKNVNLLKNDPALRVRFDWVIPEKIPTHVYLRLRVRDLAGNETVCRWPGKVSTDLVEPKGNVVELETVTETPGREGVWFPPNLDLPATATEEVLPMPREIRRVDVRFP